MFYQGKDVAYHYCIILIYFNCPLANEFPVLHSNIISSFLKPTYILAKNKKHIGEEEHDSKMGSFRHFASHYNGNVSLHMVCNLSTVPVLTTREGHVCS